jgi:hypothetical protein
VSLRLQSTMNVKRLLFMHPPKAIMDALRYTVPMATELVLE